jgi:MoaA/NifB/PqqE/SkfB family radical SAM enzyme
LIDYVRTRERERTRHPKEVLQDLIREIPADRHSFSPNKILAHPEKIVELLKREDGIPVRPFLIEIHLTNTCGHNCPNCTFAAIQGDPEQKVKQLALERVRSLLDELWKFGVRAVFWSGGGDPLCYPWAQQVFEYAGAKGFKQILITNGSNLDKVDPSVLVKYFSTVRVSLDAQTDAVFARAHGLTERYGFSPERAFEEFNRIQSNIKALVRVLQSTPRADRHPDIDRIGVGVSFLLRDINKDEVVGFCTLARDGLGVQYAEIKPLVYERNDENDAMIRRILTLELVQSIGLIRLQNRGNKLFRVFTLEHKLLDMLSDHYGKTYDKCWGHALYPAIAADGGVYTCCLMIGKSELCYGNVNELSFAQIWSGRKRREAVGKINPRLCPVNCKLSETNKTLQIVMSARALPLIEFLN